MVLFLGALARIDYLEVRFFALLNSTDELQYDDFPAEVRKR